MPEEEFEIVSAARAAGRAPAMYGILRPRRYHGSTGLHRSGPIIGFIKADAYHG